MFIGGIVVVLIIIAILAANTRSGGRSLLKRVQELGDVTEHDYSDIVAKLGAPSSISSMADGSRLAQWMATGYHVAMSFDAHDQCLGIDHEATS